MMTKKFQYFLFALIGISVFAACGDDEPEIPVEEEVITTLIYTLTPADGGDAVTLRFEDLDGDGGNAPTVQGGTLAANTTYTGSMELLNESEDPAEDITEEIEEEDEEHQFFFETTVTGLTVAYSDMDEDGNPIGLSSSLTTAGVGTGTLTVTLIHEPTKDAEGVQGGDITNAEGETDIEVEFDIVVE